MNQKSQILEEDILRICQRVDFEKLRNKTLLLTGASGLLGIYFLSCLRYLNVNRNFSISVCAVVYSEPDSFLKRLTNFEFLKILRGDLADAEFLRSLPVADFIIHAAGYGQPGRFTADPIRTLEINLVGTLGLLRKLNKNGHFLFTSSSEIYTGLLKPPFSEGVIGTTNTTHPRSCYIEGKRGGEAICQAFRNNNVNAMAARISLTYGPGTRKGDTRVLPMLIDKALAGNIILVDAGDARRTFLYIADSIEMLWKILLEGREPIYNVGGNTEVSILELAEKIGKTLDVPVKKGIQSSLLGAPVVVRLDMSLYEQEFGKSPLIDLSEGLSRAIDWQRELQK